jgi:polysaccharide export outer membrane protein
MICACVLPGLTGCVLVPKDGPSGEQVRGNAAVAIRDNTKLDYALVTLSPHVLTTVGRPAGTSIHFSRLARATRSADVRVGPADRLTVSVFEASSGGLFIPAEAGARPGNFIQLPMQEVDRTGNITVPYAGAVRALGRTATELQRDIENRLKSRAIEPQALVTINERQSNAVSVLGDVNEPKTIPLNPGGLPLLAAVARAGGSRYAGHETVVRVQRRGRVEEALLSAIANDPGANIELAPGDVVYIQREPRIFLAFGATPPPGSVGGQNNRRFLFEDESLSLAEGVAKAGGLADIRADPRSVFLFRLVPREVLVRIGVDVSKHTARLVPTIFMADWSDPQSIFLANNFPMQHRDIIFVSDSPAIDLVKFLAILSSFTDVARGSVGTAADVRRFPER